MTAIDTAYNKSDSRTQMPSVYLWNIYLYLFIYLFSLRTVIVVKVWCIHLHVQGSKQLIIWRFWFRKVPSRLRTAPRPQCLRGSKPEWDRENELNPLQAVQRDVQPELCMKSLILIRDLSQLVWLLHYKHLSAFIICAFEIRCLNSSAPEIACF